MGSRSRKRKRTVGTPGKTAAAPKPADGDDTLARGYARGRARDEATREALEPLAPGERPTVITVAAIIAAVLIPANIGAGLLLADAEPGQIPFAVLQSAVLGIAAWGMWRMKYWAVLGFQALLAIQILLLSLALLTVENILYGIGVAALVGSLGYLFVKLIRAMARMQMPERPAR